MINWKREDIIWAAGLLEGEGSFSSSSKVLLSIKCASSDKDVIEKLQRVFQLGNIYALGSHEKSLGKKPMFSWQVGRREDALAILFAIFPFMGERRKKKLKELIAGYKTVSSRRSRYNQKELRTRLTAVPEFCYN